MGLMIEPQLLRRMQSWPKTRRRQKHLSSQQWVCMARFVYSCSAARLSCAEVDEQEAEGHLRQAYAVAGLELPPVYWLDSPVAVLLEAPQVHTGDDVWAQVYQNVVDRIRGSLLRRMEGAFWRSAEEGLRVYLRPINIRDLLVRSAWEYVEERMKERVGAGGWGSVRESLRAYDEYGSLLIYRFFHDVGKENDMIHLARFNEMVSGYKLGRAGVWVMRKPIRLEIDEEGALHSESGLCVQYRDGWGLYAWHGVSVPERVIMQPERITREDWLGAEDTEVRRAMQERMPNFVERIGGECIDMGKRGKLYAVDLRSDPERVAYYVRVRDGSSEREYYLRVPPWVRGADEAVAWTFGLNLRQYRPLQES